LMTHAFFKALLFLGSGAVLHALAGQQDMRHMGGLATRIPKVAIPFLLATMSISGVPFFAGFFSKDEIIAEAHKNGYMVLWIITLVTAFLTAFYMFRLWFLTFGGKGGSFGGFWGGEYRGTQHVHAPGIRLWLPLALLAVPSVILGFWGWEPIGGNFNAFVTGNSTAAFFENPFTDPASYLGIIASLAGIGLAWLMYGLESISQNALTRNPLGQGIYSVLFNKYYVDEIYMAFIRYGLMSLSRLATLIDRYIIDGIINGVGAGVVGLGQGVRRVETGRLQTYGAAIFGGALLIAAAFFAVVYFGK
jgi:NADH-quinone oxidoreductase subunit L